MHLRIVPNLKHAMITNVYFDESFMSKGYRCYY